jgi:error-prone DNA polymerase
LHTIPAEDPAVYDMISNADTVGVFQIESRAQMSMLPRLRPRCFYDLVIEVAIVRPGPIQGDMVHPYLRRRNGEEPVVYPSEALRQVLHKTLGVPLFQEQAMKIAMVGAGFTGEEADQLRRAMAAWRRSGVLETFQPKIVNGMLRNGYTREFAEQCFNQIKGFGEYGFPESHSASFALLVYASAWIKRHHPAEFCAALLNSQPMGFYAPAQIVRDAQSHGVEVRGVDVNLSLWDCQIESNAANAKDRADARSAATRANPASSACAASVDHPARVTHPVSSTHPESSMHAANSTNRANATSRENFANPANATQPASAANSAGREPPAASSHPPVRLGFRMIKGMRLDHAERLVAARAAGPFTSVENLCRRARLPASALRRLAEADAFSSLGLSRRQSLWQVIRLDDTPAPLFDDPALQHPEPAVALPKMPLGQEVMTDYANTGLSLKKHPIALIRPKLSAMNILPASEVYRSDPGRWIRVAGLVLIRQRPGTAKGIVFETLEDETGIANLIIRPNVYDRYRPAARHAGLLCCDGWVERQGQVVHIMAARLTDLSHLLAGYQLQSRDFH